MAKSEFIAHHRLRYIRSSALKDAFFVGRGIRGSGGGLGDGGRARRDDDGTLGL